MFALEDLLQNESVIRSKWSHQPFYEGLYYVTYPQHAFRVPDSEQTIRITRAPKIAGDNGLRFWICAERIADWHDREEYFLPYLLRATFEKIGEAELNKLIACHCSELIAPPDLPLCARRGFIGGLLMHSTKTDFVVSAFAEYETEYLHFYWDTTA